MARTRPSTPSTTLAALAATLATALAASPLLAGTARAGVVEVQFEQPERYADAGRGAEAEAVRQALASHLQRLGATGLPPSQTLRVTVTDIDLAGESRPRGRWAQELRIVQGRADWPVIRLRYTLSEGPRELASGSERLIDMAYLDRLPAPSVPYAHERRLLTDWFSQRFGTEPAH